MKTISARRFGAANEDTAAPATSFAVSVTIPEDDGAAAWFHADHNESQQPI